MVDETIEAPLEMDDLKPGVSVSGKVSSLEIYGAFVDIGVGRDALLHVSQFKNTDFRSPSDVVNQGDEIEAFVLRVDHDKGRVALTMNKPPELPVSDIKVGNTYTGTVTRIESFGAFVDIGAERPGMVHVSEIADGFVQSPNDIVSVGEEVEVRVIKLNRRNRQLQIDLSMKTPVEEVQAMDEDEEEMPTAMAEAFRRAMAGQDDGLPVRGKRSKGNNKSRRSQDDILSRTLRNHSDS